VPHAAGFSVGLALCLPMWAHQYQGQTFPSHLHEMPCVSVKSNFMAEGGYGEMREGISCSWTKGTSRAIGLRCPRDHCDKEVAATSSLTLSVLHKPRVFPSWDFQLVHTYSPVLTAGRHTLSFTKTKDTRVEVKSLPRCCQVAREEVGDGPHDESGFTQTCIK
jgi:hypothetical protein